MLRESPFRTEKVLDIYGRFRTVEGVKPVGDLSLLEQTRTQLLSDLARVEESAVVFEPVPGARTIAESLMHLAAVELIFAFALSMPKSFDDHAAVELWERVKPGLATEVGYPAPNNATLDGCLQLLEDVRQITQRAFGKRSQELHIQESDLRTTLEELRNSGADLSAEHLDVFLPKLVAHLGPGSVGVALMAHEEYHRGQILYQNFLATRLTH